MFNESFFLSLIQNTTILLAFVLLYDYFWAKEEYRKNFFEKILAGLIIGGIGVVVMSVPWKLAPGLFFDTRTVLLSVSGMFFGAVPTIVGMLVTGIYRLQVGGMGVWMGFFNVLIPGIIGLLYNYVRPRWKEKRPILQLVFMSYIVHTLLLATILLLPSENQLHTFKVVLIPMLTAYPLATVLLGILMYSRAKNWKIKNKATEMQLLYESLVKNMPAGVFRKDKEGRYTFVNERFCELKGLTSEEILGKTPQELADYENEKEARHGYPVPPIQRTLVAEGSNHHRWILENGKSLVVDEAYSRSDGRKEYFQVVKTPVFDALGNVVGSQGMQFDMTAQKHSEEDLLHEQYLLAALMDYTPDSIYFKDEQGHFLRINKAQAYFLEQKSTEDAIGKTDFDYFSKEHAQKALNDELKVMQTGESIINREEKAVFSNGRYKWFLTSKFPFRDQSGKIIGTFGVSKDITPQKQMQEDLISAISRVEESDRLKTAFLHNISHEIRTPMNAIIGFSGFLKDPDLDADKKNHYADVIIQSSNQLLSIIDDIVRIATIDAGQETTKESPVLLNALLLFQYEQFLNKVTQKGLEFHYKPGLPDNQSHILTDEVKLSQVLSNLLVNALKFTQKGHIFFGYVLRGDVLDFFVEDTGIGIAKELQEEIFKRFRQADTALTRKYGGSGLGLSISKAYVDLLGGEIWVDSTVGKGSVFHFSLPYHPVATPTDKENMAMTDSLPVGNGEKTILIAEDEDLNFFLLRELLRPLQFKILRAENGLEAIHSINSGVPVDLILMDLKMPVMDGFEATRLIKDVRPDLKVLALTAYSLEADKRRALDAGCLEVIVKPVTKHLLFERLSHYLNN